ncbi:MAG: hypothetical protein AUJ85_04480 [Elusimicrobia bacterium CG1_02_37_114]|nr:MAG: hypothetical protein AUJ85_04480 [Elusimicrobia bacterium CG1_02_37_114]
MKENQKDLIKRWFEKSKNETNSFDQFISLWISFNAFYASEHLEKSERQQLDIFQNKYKEGFGEIVNSNSTPFQNFKSYIGTKSMYRNFNIMSFFYH